MNPIHPLDYVPIEIRLRNDEVAIQVGNRHALVALAAMADGNWPEEEITLARERLTVALASDWDRMQAQLSLGPLALSQHRAAAQRSALDRALLTEDLEVLTSGLEEFPELHELRLQRAALIALARDVELDAPICEIDPGAERERALTGNPQLAVLYP